MLSDQSDITVTGRASSVAESLTLAAQSAPDVLLLDYRLPDGTGAEAGARIRKLRPEVKLIFLSRDDTDAARMASVEVGASAFLHKSHAASEVVDAIRHVAHGGTLMTPVMIAALVNKTRTMNAQAQSLTPRENSVLQLIAKGISSREIARQLGISYTTVRTHIRSLGRKLDVHSKIEATAKARELGLVD